MGVAGSAVLLRWLSALSVIPDMPINVTVHPDARTYIVSLLLALASGLLFGMVPVRQVLKADPYQGIRSGAIELADRRRRDYVTRCVIGSSDCGMRSARDFLAGGNAGHGAVA